MSTLVVGDVRPSQLLWTYGPGALIDLPNLSVITMGLDRWEIDRCPPLEEARLLEAVRRVLGPQVERLRMPPIVKDENASPFTPEGKIGVPVRPFPRWLRCVRCGLLAEFDSGLFTIKENPYRPDQTHFIHSSCEKGSHSDAVPARFLLACRNGHLDDFPWHWFLPGIENFEPAALWTVVEKRKAGEINDTAVDSDDIKRPEWAVLTHPNPPTDWPHFLSEQVESPARYAPVIERVLLLKRLREVNALIGYTRVEAPEETADPDERPPMADLCRGRPDWVPATEVHGEGIFLQFNETAIRSWESKDAVETRSSLLMAGHRGWRNARKLDPEKGFPGGRYAMLHTFAHLLIRELALDCGYNAASIRERIYASSDDDPMAGILLYTAAADSDGTLGGLIELGKPDNLGRLIEQALHRASVCSSDPLCSEHDPEKDRSLHSASCHACAFVAETSCERSNRYLDRALLIPTFDSQDAAFFASKDGPHE